MPADTNRKDMKLIVACCDAYASGKSPPDAFFEAVDRQDKVLRRIAKSFEVPGHDSPDDEMLPPSAMRMCASWWLAD